MAKTSSRRGSARDRKTILYVSRNASYNSVNAARVDLGKTSVHLIGMDPEGTIVLRKHLSRRLVARRTGVINQLRAFLLERGIAIRQGRIALRTYMPTFLQTAYSVLSPCMHRLIRRLWDDWQDLEEQIEELTNEITAAIKQTTVGPVLLEVPGVGPLVATAMIAAGRQRIGLS